MNSKRAALDVAGNRFDSALELESCSGESSQFLKLNRAKGYVDSLLHPLMKCKKMTAKEVAERKATYHRWWME